MLSTITDPTITAKMNFITPSFQYISDSETEFAASAHGLVYDVKKIWIGLACVFQKTRKLFGPVNSAFHNTFDKRFPKFVSNSRSSPLRKHLKRTSETVCQKYCETQYTRTQPDIFRECFFGNERLRLRESSGSRIELQIPRSCYWVAMGYPVLKWVWFFFFFTGLPWATQF